MTVEADVLVTLYKTLYPEVETQTVANFTVYLEPSMEVDLDLAY